MTFLSIQNNTELMGPDLFSFLINQIFAKIKLRNCVTHHKRATFFYNHLYLNFTRSIPKKSMLYHSIIKRYSQTYLHMMWHNLNIEGCMKPCFRWIEQKILWLTGIDIRILMNMICKTRFLTFIRKECGSKRAIKHSLHLVAGLTPAVI